MEEFEMSIFISIVWKLRVTLLWNHLLCCCVITVILTVLRNVYLYICCFSTIYPSESDSESFISPFREITQYPVSCVCGLLMLTTATDCANILLFQLTTKTILMVILNVTTLPRILTSEINWTSHKIFSGHVLHISLKSVFTVIPGWFTVRLADLLISNIITSLGSNTPSCEDVKALSG